MQRPRLLLLKSRPDVHHGGGLRPTRSATAPARQQRRTRRIRPQLYRRREHLHGHRGGQQGEGQRSGDFSLTTACTREVRFVEGATGEVTAADGSSWIVPMQTDKTEGRGAVEFFNDCTGSGDNPTYLDDLDTVVVDEDGEVITAALFADNYYELYINGVFVARDRINFIPFNSTVVRFQASYPLTIAVHLADWELISAWAWNTSVTTSAMAVSSPASITAW